MKKTALLVFILTFTQICSAQTYLKANLIYWSVGIVNVSVETKLAKKWTFNSDWVYSPWKSIRGNHFIFLQIIPEARFYPKGAFNGLYFGGYGAFQAFDLTKWNYWNTGRHQEGFGLSLGASIGYSYQINSRLGLDVYAGAGWQDSWYKGYYTQTNEKYIEWNGSGEWLPYKLGIAITYKL